MKPSKKFNRLLEFSSDGIVRVKSFQNKSNKQFNLAVLKKDTSPMIKDLLRNKNVLGFDLTIKNIIMKNGKGGIIK